jgi:hypothetical protein
MNALESLLIAVKNTLSGDIWGDRVYSDSAPATAEKPYVVYFWSGGGEANETTFAQDARLLLSVKCVADTMQESMTGANRISALLNDQGLQDVGNTITGDNEWAILTITQGGVLHLKEMFEGAMPIYHDGYQFDVSMEAV